MVHIKNILIIALLILVNFFVYFLEIESEQIALFILCATSIYVIYGLVVAKAKCDDKGVSCDECLIGPTKSYAGMFDNGCLDVWHVKHMLLWFLIGMLSPNYILLVFYASVTYEISEHVVFKYMCGKEAMFCGRYEDILINVFFYYAGSYVRNKRNEKIIEKSNI